jgi:DNA helicase-2/ATP-dependent DNA helicase PcrA
VQLILGGPGCGKTYTLLDEVEKELKAGVRPNEIAFMAFTRKAANEARSRAMEKFGLSEEDLPYFRTLHSFAFKQLQLTPSQVMSETDFRAVGEVMGLTFGAADVDLGVHTGDDDGSQRLYLDQLARLTRRPLRDVCREHKIQIWQDVKMLSEALLNYKNSRRILDFTDMLERFIEEGECPRFKVVFIDEAQDLSPLQWLVVERIVQNSERVYMAGDDDQAIYEWSGADVKTFLGLQGTPRVLPLSKRLPRIVFNKGGEILSRIKHRFAKEWSPAYEGGTISRYGQHSNIPITDGTWYMLARNRYLLSPFVDFLRDRGYPYVLLGRSSIDNANTRALLAWEHVRRGDAIKGSAAKGLFTKLRPGGISKASSAGKAIPESALVTYEDLRAHGLLVPKDEDWMSAVHMPIKEQAYYRNVRKRGESLLKIPRITVSTIHQVKGGEADHVAISRDVSLRCFEALHRTPDTEHRVFYVAATRAKKSLHIIHPRTNKHYDF